MRHNQGYDLITNYEHIRAIQLPQAANCPVGAAAGYAAGGDVAVRPINRRVNRAAFPFVRSGFV